MLGHPLRPAQMRRPAAPAALQLGLGIAVQDDPRHLPPVGAFGIGIQQAEEPRARRWAMALQAYDGMTEGASHRDIAAALFGEKAVRDDWCGRSEYLRQRVQRLLQVANALVKGDYRDLLK